MQLENRTFSYPADFPQTAAVSYTMLGKFGNNRSLTQWFGVVATVALQYFCFFSG